jgi:hypothetical protein
MKPKTCKHCHNKFTPERPMQSCCSIPCAIEWGKRQSAKAERIYQAEARKIIKVKIEATKPPSYWRKRAQDVFNKWVRLVKCAGMPCISCGKHHTGQNHAGHYQNAGDHPELAFEPDNVWLQCKPCNTDKHGNIIAYRQNLVALIGLDRVEWLEGPHELPHCRKEDFQAIEAHYKQLLKGVG